VGSGYAVTRTLFEDEYITLTLDEARSLVRYIRSDVPFTSMTVMRALHARIAALIPEDAGLKLLLDVRQAPSRNDPEFETEIMRAFGTFLPKFDAHAVVARTAAGRLQAQRLERQHNTKEPGVFDNEAEALRFLGMRPQ
jgi:hypothetical protein